MLLDDALHDPGLAHIALARLAAQIRDERGRAAQTLSDAELRVKRAEEHLADLRKRLDAWAKEQDHGVRQTPDGFVRIQQSGPPLPREMNLIVGEAVQNLRTALDYLVYGLSWLDSGVHHEQTQFPIAETEVSFKSQQYRLAGLTDAHVASIQALQPFAGCEWTGPLRDASNQDKHWALQVAIGQGSVSATNVGQPDFEVQLDVRIVFEEGRDILEWLTGVVSNVRDTLASFSPDFEEPVVLEFGGMRAVIEPQMDASSDN